MASIAECHRVHGRPQKFDTFIAKADDGGGAVTEGAARGAGLVGPAPSPIIRAASSAFTPDQLAARLDAYAARAKLLLPLFADGKPAVEVPTMSTGRRPGRPVRQGAMCYGCGVTAPAQAVREMGWALRMLKGGQGETECYCPECFDAFGWGDSEDE